MNEQETDVIQGTLDMLILKTLSLEPMHGFGIARRVEQISRGVFKVNPGSLLTALRQVLHAHPRRQEAAGDRNRGLDPPGNGDRAAPQGGGLVACPYGVSSDRACAAC
jgi:hypothetical protein